MELSSSKFSEDVPLYGSLECESVRRSVVSDSLWPHGLQLPRLLCPQDSLGKNTGVSGCVLFQGIFLTQGLNPGLLHCRQSLYHPSHQGSPYGNLGQLQRLKGTVTQSCFHFWHQGQVSGVPQTPFQFSDLPGLIELTESHSWLWFITGNV